MDYSWVAAAFFLPLFPLSAGLLLLVRKITNPWLRAALFLLWPQVGVALLLQFGSTVPDWVSYWALLTALLYSFRALVLRDLMLWLSYIAVSAWAVLWVILPGGGQLEPSLFALGMSLPMALMAVLGGELEKRFNAAFAGLYGGIARSQPRLSAMLVFTLLAVMATPLFPGFFAMLSSIMLQMRAAPGIAVGLLVVWFFWSWSGILMMQGLVMGPRQASTQLIDDLPRMTTGLYGLILLGMVVFGLQFVVIFK